jgi:predicted O-methyltransferase YrrM
MTMSEPEPTTPEAIAEWIRSHVAASDELRDIAEATEAHRVEHGCDAFAGGDGPLLRVLATALRPGRLLEVGTALGYSGLNLLLGAGGEATLDAIERDPVHADLAIANFAARGVADRVRVHVGSDLDVVAVLEETEPYDLVFYDAAVPTPAHLAAFDRLLAPGGVLLTSNLFLGQYVPDLPGLEEGAAYREALFGARWRTVFLGGKALSVRR